MEKDKSCKQQVRESWVDYSNNKQNRFLKKVTGDRGILYNIRKFNPSNSYDNYKHICT